MAGPQYGQRRYGAGRTPQPADAAVTLTRSVQTGLPVWSWRGVNSRSR